ncbi:MAG: GNAT family N-acetyltransferase [Lachnospiraceae bacterium]|nr:GNAT family N-acetyltransferase [Lachnospiraceae bacterium]
MEKGDYNAVAALWASIKGMGIRSIDDSEEYVCRFIERNPLTSVVAVDGDRIVGSVLCGHDGRQACFYHVCVAEDHRLCGIGRAMVDRCVEGLKAEHINRIYLIAFKHNTGGNSFWRQLGWECRNDRNYYELYLNDENQTTFIV